MLRALSVSVGLLVSVASLCHAQVADHAAKHATSPSVGADDIFHALTQPDRPADIEALRDLRDTLSRPLDRAALEQVRAQLDALLQRQERAQGDMPPALVMSGIASRIDSAVSALEAARRAPPPAPTIQPAAKQPPWLVPALGAAAATLAAGLLACLIALASQGSPAAEAEEIREALAKIRRRLDEPSATAGKAQGLSDAEREEAAATLHEAAVTAGRLNSTIKEADAKLRATVEEADTRLNAAAGVAGQFEQWLEALPARLIEAVSAMEEGGLSRLDEAASQLAGSTSALAELASSLPATQQALQEAVAGLGRTHDESLQALSSLTARAEQAGEALPALAAACAEAGSAQHLVTQGAEALQSALVAFQAAAARTAEPGGVEAPPSDALVGAVAAQVAEAVQAAIAEFTSSAELLTELNHLSYGQSLRLEDAVMRAEGALGGLPALEHSLTSAAERLLVHEGPDRRDAGADRGPDVADLQQALAEALTAIQARGIEAVDQAAERLAASAANAATAAEAAAGLPDAKAALHDAVAAISQAGAANGAAWEEAVARIAVLAQAAPKVAEALAAATVALKTDLSSAAEGLAAGRSAVMHVAEVANTASAGLNAGAAQLQAILEAASSLPAHAAALAETAQTLRQTTDERDAEDLSGGRLSEQADMALNGLHDLAERMQRVSARMEMELEKAEAARTRADAELLAGQAAQADSFGAVLEALAARADASMGVLPAEASALAAVSAELRADAAALGAAADRLIGGAASETIVLTASMHQALDALNAACRRLEEHWAHSGGGAAASNHDMVALRDEARRMLAELDGTQQSVAALAREAGSATQEAAAVLARAEHRLASASANLSNSDAHGVLALQTERLADLLDSGVQIAARLEAAAAQAVAPAASSARQAGSAPHLGELEAAIVTVQAAASRLAKGAEAQEAALTKVTEAAAKVVTLALAETAPPPAAEVSLTRLASMATETETLQTVAERMAEAALRGDTLALSPELVSQTPILLATIETSIHRLRGAATALALASDAQRKAA